VSSRDLVTDIDGNRGFWYAWTKCRTVQGSIYPRERIQTSRLLWLIRQFRIVGGQDVVAYVPSRSMRRLLPSLTRHFNRVPGEAFGVTVMAAAGLETLACVCSWEDHEAGRTPYRILGGVEMRRGGRTKGGKP